jgi:predicted O-methyltransferase YrrM
MRFAEVRRVIGGVPFITPEHALDLYNLILRERCEQILELGIAHGTATCYMAAALEELGSGRVTAVDLRDADFTPAAEEQLERSGLQRYADVVRMHTGYTWFLHDEIRRQSTEGVCRPKYDLCIIDGPKNWTIDGCAFFLVDKLLKTGGWIIFDDYAWTYAAADASRTATDGISHRALSEEERTTPHIREVFELLVMQHPHYSNFVVYDHQDWAMAQKVPSAGEKTFTVRHRSEYGDLLSRVKQLTRRVMDERNRTLGGFAAARRPKL